MITTMTDEALRALEDEAVAIACELIRIDSSNYGPDVVGPGERAVADYVLGLLHEVGLEPTLIESAPGRASVIVRLAGADPSRGGLVVHGHLDVVPAAAEDWQGDPFAGEVRDGMIWGRGAVDMKDMDAMMLANLRRLAREHIVPPRDLVFCFFADEEAGGTYGSEWLVEHHPELFAGCTEAISEVGGYSVTLPLADGSGTRRAYLVQTAEKGLAWLRLRAVGRAGHASLPNDENAIVWLTQAIDRISAHVWPCDYVPSVQELFAAVSDITGLRPQDPVDLLPLLGGARRFVQGSLCDGATFTVLKAGYKANVVPSVAEATIDLRFLPGHQDEALGTIRALAGEHCEVIVDKIAPAVEAPHEGGFFDAMRQALLGEDPGAAVLPYCLSAGTDNKWLGRLGIAGYGFVPLQLPDDLDFAALFHAVDERVPVDAVKFGTRVLRRLFESC